MATSGICIGQRQACALRVTRLDSDCTVSVGADNAVVTAGLVTLNLEPEIEEGQVFEPKSACDSILWTAEEPDKIKRYTGDGEIGVWDYELIELMTDAAVVLGDATSPWSGDVIGVSMPGPSTASSNGVGLEIWTKGQGVGATGPCGGAATHPPYVRHVFPRVLIRPGGHTFENDAAMFTFSMKASANPQWGNGPWNDWQPASNMPADSPYIQFYDDALPTTQCGYITVPNS